MQLSLAAALLLPGSAALAQSDSWSCRDISDAARRLACYDARDRASAPTAPPVAAPAPAAPAALPAYTPPAPVAAAPAPSPAPAPVVTTASRPRAFTSRVAAVTRLPYGLFRIDLDNGTVWETTTPVTPPAVGQSVDYRRSLIGSHGFDIDGRRDRLIVRPHGEGRTAG